MSSNPLKWGILATGGIAQTFVTDILQDPSIRNANDIAHKIVAMGSSSSLIKAQEFVTKFIAPLTTTERISSYGSYEELVADQNVEIVYVASPQSHHYSNVMLALEAGKHVLCEKPMTINAAQTAHLMSIANHKNLFLMEAVWTRFFPGVLELKRLLHSERILGKIHRVISDFSLNLTHIRNFQHRLYDPTLGGGALLDLGLYPITWAFMTLFDDPDNQVNGQKIAPIVHASMILSQGKPEDGWKGPVDESTSITLTFEKLHATAVLTTSLLCHTTYGRSVLIQGDKGDIIIPSSAPRPGSYILQLKGQEPTTVEIPNGGLHWQADACARAIRSDKTGTVECPMEDTLAVMTVMDAVRKQGGLAFPADLEAVRT